VRRLRLWAWTRIYLWAAKLTSKAIVKRAEACGCDECKWHAHIMLVVHRASRAAQVARLGCTPKEERVVN
jgi:hypothetical protein